MRPKVKVRVEALRRPLPMWSWLWLGAALAAVLVILTSCAPAQVMTAPAPPAATDAALPAEVSVDQAKGMRDGGAFVLDVRTQEEWNAFHIPDATLIPLDQLQTRLSEVPKDKDVLVVCRTGHRSAQGRDVLLAAGYPRVTSMAGGVTEWQAKGLPTVTGP